MTPSERVLAAFYLQQSKSSGVRVLANKAAHGTRIPLADLEDIIASQTMTPDELQTMKLAVSAHKEALCAFEGV